MRRLSVGLLLPMAASVAITGSGFAIWAFKANTKSVAFADVEVTQLAKVGSFSQAENSSLVLDQSPKKGLGGEGIYLSFPGGDSGMNGVEYIEESAASPIGKEKLKASISTFVFVRKEISDYVRVSDGIAEVRDYALDYAFDEKRIYSPSSFKGYIVSWPEGAKRVTLPSKGEENALFRFEYAKGREPETEEDYFKMRTIVSEYGENAIAMVSEARLGKTRI